MLCPMFLTSLPLEVRRITVPLPQRKLQNGFEFSLEMWVALLTEFPSKNFDTFKFKIRSLCSLTKF